MRWLCHIPAEFQVHLAFSFLYRCNNWGTYQQMIFQQFQMFKKNPFPLFLMDNIKLDEIPSKIKQKCDCFILHHRFCRCFFKKLRDAATSLFISCVLHQQRKVEVPQRASHHVEKIEAFSNLANYGWDFGSYLCHIIYIWGIRWGFL